MASHLNLEEQEQLDRVKQLWKQYGNLVTWVVIIALGGFAAFSQYQNWQRGRSAKAGALYEELDQAAQTGDMKKVERVFGDLREKYPATVAAEQAGLRVAKLQFDFGQPDAARASLEWVVAHGAEKEYQVIARLRLAGLLLDQKKPEEALQALPTDVPPAFEALVADRRGDILHAQGKHAEAKAAWQQALDKMEARLDYRRLVEAKLSSLGPNAPSAAPVAASAAAPASAPVAAGAASAPVAAGAASAAVDPAGASAPATAGSAAVPAAAEPASATASAAPGARR
jgi:predicted negative regulator of RcsB-dependent stress response